MNNGSIYPPPEKESPPAANQAGFAEKQTKPERSATPRKWQRVLHAFVDGRSLNRFKAARESPNWCLNMTVNQLEPYKIVILRFHKNVPATHGPGNCWRYHIVATSMANAQNVPDGKKSAPALLYMVEKLQ